MNSLSRHQQSRILNSILPCGTCSISVGIEMWGIEDRSLCDPEQKAAEAGCGILQVTRDTIHSALSTEHQLCTSQVLWTKPTWSPSWGACRPAGQTINNARVMRAMGIKPARSGAVRGRGSQGRWHWICWGLSHQFTRSALGMIQPLRSLHDAGRCGINPPSHTVLPTSVSCKDEGDPCYFSGLCTGASGNHLSPGLGSPQGQSSGDGHPAAMWQVTASPWHPDGS